MRFTTLVIAALATASSLLALPSPRAEIAAECRASNSPAFDPTKTAFESFKNAELYMLGSVINNDPTHTELEEAAKWQIGQVKGLITKAEATNNADSNFARKTWFKVKIDWLKLEIKVAETMIAAELPKFPWLGKLYEWGKKEWGSFKDAWNKFWHHKGGKNGSATEAIWESFGETDEEAPSDPMLTAKANQVVDGLRGKATEADAQIKELQTGNVCAKTA